MSTRRSLEAWLATWLSTRIVVRDCGRSHDMDEIASVDALSIGLPLTAVTAWNPEGRPRDAGTNRDANRRLRPDLDSRGLAWRPSVGRAADGSWSEPGFAVTGLSEAEAAELGAAWGQLAVFVVTLEEVVVLGAVQPFRRARPRGRLIG